jgi:hypothetical protein
VYDRRDEIQDAFNSQSTAYVRLYRSIKDLAINHYVKWGIISSDVYIMLYNFDRSLTLVDGVLTFNGVNLYVNTYGSFHDTLVFGTKHAFDVYDYGFTEENGKYFNNFKLVADPNKLFGLNVVFSTLGCFL